jgi:hypothetical protein
VILFLNSSSECSNTDWMQHKIDCKRWGAAIGREEKADQDLYKVRTIKHLHVFCFFLRVFMLVYLFCLLFTVGCCVFWSRFRLARAQTPSCWFTTSSRRARLKVGCCPTRIRNTPSSEKKQREGDTLECNCFKEPF